MSGTWLLQPRSPIRWSWTTRPDATSGMWTGTAIWTSRQAYILAFYNAFHGRTLGALSLTASKPVQRRGFAPLLPGVFHAPYPDPYRSRSDDPAAECLDHIENVLFGTVLPPEETAAVFV